MTRRGLLALLGLLLPLAVMGCVQTLPLDGRACGCVAAFRCCAATNRCVSAEEAAGARCQVAADGDAAVPAPADAAPVADAAPADDAAPVDAPADALAMEVAPPPDVMPDVPHGAPELGPEVKRDCAIAARRCAADGRAPQRCDEDGRWVTELPCELACWGGVCTACTPGTRRCDASQQPQLCDPGGQWRAEPACPEDDVCSAGLCLCGESCNLGLLHETAGLVSLVAGREGLWFHDQQKLWRLDLGTRQVTEPHPVGTTHKPLARLALDEAGELFWCRQDLASFTTAVMRNGAPFLPMSECQGGLLNRGSLLYVNSGGTVTQHPPTMGLPPDVASGTITAFAVDDQHIYFGNRARAFSQFHRRPLFASGPAEMLWEQTNPGDPVSSVAIDGEHAYFAAGPLLLRLPVSGTPAEQATIVSQEVGRTVGQVVLSDSHVYWTVSAMGSDGACAGTEVYRRPKQPVLRPAHRLIHDPGPRCATALARAGDQLYLGNSTSPVGLGPGRIVRLAH
jgi:hypothetical protein